MVIALCIIIGLYLLVTLIIWVICEVDFCTKAIAQSIITIGCVLAIGIIVSEGVEANKIPENIDGKYYDVLMAKNDDVNIEVVTTIYDKQVKRTSSIKLMAKDFKKDEVNAGTKALNNTINTMLENRQAEIDSLVKLYNTKITDLNDCEIRKQGETVYKICKMD